MATDALVRLVLDNSAFNSKLAQSRKGMKDMSSVTVDMSDVMKAAGSAITKLAATFGVAKSALDVLKDAFFANEQNLDEWGRTVDSARNIYDGFLKSLNSGDISGYLSNIDKIVSSARDAYDALDALGTYNAFNQINDLKKRNNLENAINNYKEGKGSKADIQKAGNDYIKELQTRQTYESSAYKGKIDAIAAKNGVSAKAMYQILTGENSAFERAKAVRPTGTRTVTMGGGSTGYQHTFTQTYARTSAEKMGQALRMFNDTELKATQALGAQSVATAIEIEGVRKRVNRAVGNTGKTSGGGGGTHTGGGRSGGGGTDETVIKDSIGDYQKQISAFRKELDNTTDHAAYQAIQDKINELQECIRVIQQGKISTEGISSIQGADVRSGIGGLPSADNMGTLTMADLKMPEFQTDSIAAYNEQLRELNELLDTLTIGSEAYNVVAGEINATQKEMSVKQMNAVGRSSEDMANNFATAASAVSQCTNALAGFGGTSINIAATIAGAIATIAAAYAQNLAGDNTSKGNIYAFIGAAAAATISMVATIASMKSATAYAEGGVVGGNSYEGDKLYGRLNSGEVVLNQVQAARANAALDSAGGGGQGYVSGENIYIAMNNYGRRTGRGELVFSRR